MLKKYLQSIPPTKKVVCKPFDAHALGVATQIIAQIQKIVPGLEVKLMGSLPLKIYGQQDIDISIFCKKELQALYLPKIELLYGVHSSSTNSAYQWQILVAGFETEIWLADPD